MKRSDLTIKTPERRQLRRSGVFIVNFEHISHLVLVFPLLTLKMSAGKSKTGRSTSSYIKTETSLERMKFLKVTLCTKF